MFALPVLTYTQPGAAADVLRWRHSTLDLARERAAAAAPARRRLSLADDPRPGVLGVLAGRHRRVPHRQPTSPTPRCATSTPPATRRSSATSASSCWSRRPGCGARSVTTTATGTFHLDGVTGPDEYTRARRRQRLHEPDGGPEPGRRGRRTRRPIPRWRTGSASTRRRPPRGATRPRRWRCRTTTTSACTSSARTSPATRSGTSPTPTPDDYPLLLHVSVLRPLPQAGGQAGRPGARDALARGRVHRRSRRPATSPTTRRGRCATRRCRPPPRPCWPPRSGHLDLAHDYIAEAALVDLRDTAQQHPRRRAHRLAGRRLDRPGGRASAGCVTTTAGSPSRPRLPTRIDRLEFSVHWRGSAAAGHRARRRGHLQLRDGSATRIELTHHGEALVVTAGPARHPTDPADAPADHRGRSSRPGRGSAAPVLGGYATHAAAACAVRRRRRRRTGPGRRRRPCGPPRRGRGR